MGFLPKHIKVRRYKRNLNLIATAALRGARFHCYGWPTTGKRLWVVTYLDGRQGMGFTSRGGAVRAWERYNAT